MAKSFRKSREKTGLPAIERKTGKKGRKKAPIIIGIVLVLVILVLVVVPRMMPQSLPQIAVEAVTKEDLTARVDTSGTVESLKTKTYFSPVNASVAQCGFKVGEVVKPGDSLITFNTETLEEDNQKAILNAEATINGSKDSVAQAALTKQKASEAAGLVPGLQASADNYETYIADLKNAIAERTRALSANASQASTDASVALTRAQADLQKKQQELEKKNAEAEAIKAEIDGINSQLEEIKKEGGDTAALNTELTQLNTELTNITNQCKQLENEVNAQNDTVTNLTVNQIQAQQAADPSSDAQIVAWQNELDKAQTELADVQSELAEKKSIAQSGDSVQVTDAAKAQMEATNNIAELEAASLEELLEKGKQGIQAEFSGIVSKADVVDGAAATQGMELVTVASNEEVAVNVSVSKYDYDKLKEGQKAEITIADHTYQGTVSKISKIATVNEKGAPVIWAEVTIDNPDDNIFLGVEAKVSIETDSVKGAVCVPASAVNTGKDSTFCYIVKDGVITKQKVVTGISSTENTQIKEGLSVGDAVISELPDGYMEGMQVEAVGADDMKSDGKNVVKE